MNVRERKKYIFTQDNSSAVNDGNPVMILSPTRESLYLNGGDDVSNPFVVANPDITKNNELPVMSTFRPSEVCPGEIHKRRKKTKMCPILRLVGVA